MTHLDMKEAQHDDVRRWVEGYLNPCPVTPEVRSKANEALAQRLPTLAFLPGTGLQSGALAYAYGAVGFPVLIGSRTFARAEACAAELVEKTKNTEIRGAELAEAAAQADVIFWLMPTTTAEKWRDSLELLKSLERHLAGKTFIDVTNILWFHGQSSWGQKSSTLFIANVLSPSSNIRLVSAFKHIYYRLIIPGNQPKPTDPHDVFVCSDDAAAAAMVIALVDRLPGFRGLYAGDLQYSRIVELLSPLWLAQIEKDNFGTLFYAGWRFRA